MEEVGPAYPGPTFIAMEDSDLEVDDDLDPKTCFIVFAGLDAVLSRFYRPLLNSYAERWRKIPRVHSVHAERQLNPSGSDGELLMNALRTGRGLALVCWPPSRVWMAAQSAGIDANTRVYTLGARRFKNGGAA